MNITTCMTCGALYEESSEELANDPNRECHHCYQERMVMVGTYERDRDEAYVDEENDQ